MKALRIAGLSLLGLVFILGVGLFIFIKTFDLNTYLPEITNTISKSSGLNCSISRADLHLSWQGLILDVQGVGLTNKDKAPVFEAAQAQASVKVWPLITQKTFDFGAFRVSRILVHVIDPKTPLTIPIPVLVMTLTNVDLNKPFQFKLDTAIANANENIHVQGRVKFDAKQSSVVLTDVQASAELSDFNIDQIRAMSPALKTAMLPSSMQGQLNVIVKTLEAGPKGLVKLDAIAQLSNGQMAFKEILKPISSISAEVLITEKNAVFRQLEARINDGKIAATGQLMDYQKAQTFTGQGTVSQIAVEDLIDFNSLPVGLKGKIQGHFAFEGKGLGEKELLKNLKGQTEIDLLQGVLERFNVAKLVLGKTGALIPGLAQALDQKLSETLKSKDADGDNTILDQVHAKITVEDQVIFVDDAYAQAKSIQANAKGTVNFDLSTDINVNLVLDKDLSENIVKEVEQLAYLRGEDGTMKLAATLKGVIPKLSFDLTISVKDVSKNAIIQEGSKQLEKVIEKNPEVGEILNSIFGEPDAGSAQTPGTPAADAQTQAPVPEKDSQQKANDIINNVLQKILE